MKDLSPTLILYRKKSLQHIHVQSLPESTGTGNQSHIVLISHHCLIKSVFHYQLFKTLNPYSYGSRHDNMSSPLLQLILLYMFPQKMHQISVKTI